MYYFFSKLFNKKLFNKKLFNKNNFNENNLNTFFKINKDINIKENIKIITGLSISVLILNYAYSSDFNNDTQSYLKNKEITERYIEYKYNE